MKTLSPDTSPEMEKKWIELLRTQTPEQRLLRVIRLNNGGRAIKAAGIRLRYPDADEHEVRMRLLSTWLDRNAMIRLFGWDPDAEGVD